MAEGTISEIQMAVVGEAGEGELGEARRFLANQDVVDMVGYTNARRDEVRVNITRVLDSIEAGKGSNTQVIDDLSLLAKLGDRLNQRGKERLLTGFLDANLIDDEKLKASLEERIDRCPDGREKRELAAVVLGVLARSAARTLYSGQVMEGMMKKYRGVIEKGVEAMEQLRPTAATNLRWALMYETREQQFWKEEEKWAKTAAKKAFEGLAIRGARNRAEDYRLLAYAMCYYSQTTGGEDGVEIVAGEMERQLGIRAKLVPRLAKLWTKSNKFELTERMVDLNLAIMLELEDKMPGSINYLFGRCGIANFGRYPRVVLEKQFTDWQIMELVARKKASGEELTKDEKDAEIYARADRGYVLVAYPYRDDSIQDGGAFYNDVQKLNILQRKLGELGYGMRVCELGYIQGSKGKNSVKRFLAMARDFGPCDVCIAGAHGSETSMSFEAGKVGEFGVGDLPIAAKYRDRFVKNGGQIVLSSCLTGVDRGLAEQMANRLKIRVDAPEEATTEKAWRINTEKVDGVKRLRLEPEYFRGRRKVKKPSY